MRKDKFGKKMLHLGLTISLLLSVSAFAGENAENYAYDPSVLKNAIKKGEKSCEKVVYPDFKKDQVKKECKKG